MQPNGFNCAGEIRSPWFFFFFFPPFSVWSFFSPISFTILGRSKRNPKQKESSAPREIEHKCTNWERTDERNDPKYSSLIVRRPSHRNEKRSETRGKVDLHVLRHCAALQPHKPYVQRIRRVPCCTRWCFGRSGKFVAFGRENRYL